MGLTLRERDLCMLELTALSKRSDDIACAMLALRDGRTFAHLLRQNVEPGRLAAMASSLVALGGSVLKELGVGPLDHMLIHGQDGPLVVTRIPDCGGLMVLAVLATKSARPGLVLSHTKLCGLAIGRIIALALQ